MNKSIFAALLAFSAVGAMQAADEIITETPAGDVKQYSRDGYNFYVGSGDQVFYSIDIAYASEFVFCDNNEVYIKNPITGLLTNSYLKGTLDNGVVTVKLPQAIYAGKESGQDVVYYVNRMVYNPTQLSDGRYVTNYTVVEDEAANQIRFGINSETGVIKIENDFAATSTEVPYYLMGVSYQDANGQDVWGYYGDANQIYTPFTEEITTLPDNLTDKMEKWEMTYWMTMNKQTQDTKLINVAFDEDNGDVYIGNLYKDDMKNSYIKGKLADGKITIPSGQYLGIESIYNHYIYAMGCTVDRRLEDLQGTDVWVPYLVFQDDLVLDYDATEKQIWSDMVLDLNKGVDIPSSIKIYVEPVIQWQDLLNPAQPMAPEWNSIFNDDSPDVNYTSIWLFFIPKKDVNGKPLDPNNMYYNMYVDGEPFSLYPADYPMVTVEDLYNVPYNFDNNYNVRVNGELHQVIVYFKSDFELVTLESVYVKEDGTELRSAPASASAVKEIQNVSVAATEYYDLAGRRAVNPGRGLWIKCERLDNGQTRTSKIMIK